jgi:hypothetical protein
MNLLTVRSAAAIGVLLVLSDVFLSPLHLYASLGVAPTLNQGCLRPYDGEVALNEARRKQ